MRFEDSLLGNKPYKGEGSKDNNSKAPVAPPLATGLSWDIVLHWMNVEMSQ